MPTALLTAAAITSGTTQQITGSLGGATPVLAMVEITGSVTIGTTVSRGTLSKGFTDGTRSRCLSIMSEDASNVSVSHAANHRLHNNRIAVVMVAGSSAIDGECTATLIANGIELSWSDHLATGLQVKVMVWYGEEWAAYVNDYAGDPDENDPATVTGVPFRPRGLITLCGRDSAGSGAAVDAIFGEGYGALNEDGSVHSQCSFTHFEENNPPTSTKCAAGIADDRIAHRIDISSGTFTAECTHELTAGTSDGFTVTTRDGSAALTVIYAALRNGNRRFQAIATLLDSDNTGDKTVTTAFQLDSAIGVSTNLASVNNYLTGNIDSGSFSLGAIDSTGSAQYASDYTSEDAVATSDTYSAMSTGWRLISLAGGVDWTGSITARTTTSFTYNVSNASDSDRYLLFFVFEKLLDIAPTGIASTTAFGTPSLKRYITPTGITSATSFGTATIGRGAVNVSPSGIASTTSFGTPSLRLNIAPTGIVSTTSFGAATLTRGAVNLSPSGIASTTSFGTATLTRGAVNVSPGGIASTTSFGVPSLRLNIAPTGIASTTSFGTATITSTVNVSPGGIASTTSFGTAVIGRGAVSVSPAGIASTTSFGIPQVLQGVQIVPTGIASTTTFGTAVIGRGAVTVSPTGIASTTSFGAPSLRYVIAPTGIASTTSFGTASIGRGAVNIGPSGIASTTSFGVPSLRLNISPAGISSTTSFGTATITQNVVISPLGVASTTSFGTATITSSATVAPAGIASTTAFGTPSVLLTVGQVIAPGGIASTTSLGVPIIRGGLLPVTMKKRIHDALCDAALRGRFIQATYPKDEDCVLEQGLEVEPQSVEVNEITNRFAVEGRQGRSVQQDNTRWLWLLIVRFDVEVISEPFEQSLLDAPLCVHREDNAPLSRQARVLLVDCDYKHPPRGSPSNGTEIRYRFEAVLSPK